MLKLKFKLTSLIAIISVAAGTVGLVGSAQMAMADSVNAGPLIIDYPGSGPIFSESNISAGQNFVKTLTVSNNGTVNHSFALATRNVEGDLASKLYIKPNVSGADVWSQTVADLANLPTGSRNVIASIAPGQSATVNLRAEFEQSAGNNYQNENLSFDFVFGSEEVEPSASATPPMTGLISRVRSFFATAPESITTTPSVTPSVTATATAEGEVKGENTGNDETGLDPWLLLIAPAAVVASAIFLPEFIFATGTAAVSGGVIYALGYSFKGDMDPVAFYIILGAEVLALVTIAYFMLHHNNRASRRIKGYRHRLRIR